VSEPFLKTLFKTFFKLSLNNNINLKKKSHLERFIYPTGFKNKKAAQMSCFLIELKML